MLSYQKGFADQFFYKYIYDADNRLIESHTSNDNLQFNRESRHSYYLHGPLSRLELGNGVQGIDYAYTLSCWMKSINGKDLIPEEEIGKDGGSNSIHKDINRDDLAFTLGYFAGDYTPIGGTNTLAVSRNLNQFIWTLILLFVAVYVYSLLGLYFLQDRFQDNDVGALCRDAYSCLLASLNLGLRAGGGIADTIQKFKYDEDNKAEYLVNTLFDLSFFIIIVTVLLNLIFGMIIDAFGDLRDEKSSNEEDKENVCFICGLQRSEYERTDNFEKHIEKEHNMWVYLAYLVYIQDKSRLYPTEMTDTEDYVADRYQNKDYIWVPIGRSLTLERHLVKGEKQKKSEIEKLKEGLDHKLDNILGQTKFLISRMNEVLGNDGEGSTFGAKNLSKSPTKSKWEGLTKATTFFLGSMMKSKTHPSAAVGTRTGTHTSTLVPQKAKVL